MLNDFFKKKIKTGEMLNLLDMLNRWGKIGPLTPKYLTYLTFPCFKHSSKKLYTHETREIFQKVLKTGEMQFIKNFGGLEAPFRPTD